MKRITILGSSGSIGVQALDVVRAHRDRFDVVGLAVHSSTDVLKEQIAEFHPRVVAVSDLEAAAGLGDMECEVLPGEEGVAELAGWDEADAVVNALVGSAGLRSTLAVIDAGKKLALANKESMVAGGALVKRAMEHSATAIIPVDSEHSAIFQCLAGEKHKGIAKLILTGSGGPFRGRKREELAGVTDKEALAHPRWKMGPKITIDSATLMNKGLEVIEAHYLFDIDYDHIEVLIHPQSILHSMVEFADGSLKAQLGATDMRLPIQYALTYPEHIESPVEPIDLAEIGLLTFEKPDLENFPALSLAVEAGKRGGGYPAVLNAANEEAVAAFLAGSIRFLGITEVVEKALEAFDGATPSSFDILMKIESEARATAREEIKLQGSGG